MKGFKLYLWISGLLLLLYVLAQYYKPKPTNWQPSYLKEDKIPFGLYILQQQIKDVLPGVQIEYAEENISHTLNGRKFTNATYLIVGGTVELSNADYVELKRFMEAGNSVFMATFDIQGVLKRSLKLRSGAYYTSRDKKSVPINFVSPSARTEYPYTFGKGLGDQFFGELDTAKAIVLGKNENGETNFVKYPFGKGALYVLPNPQLLCNYSLLNPDGAEYAAKALSYVLPCQKLIWDEHHLKNEQDTKSPLSVIFKYDALRWAYYLALAGILLFVGFEMKRRQRIIPVLEPLQNSSVEFVNVVGRVYYQQRNNTDISLKKINYFLEFIRARYHLKTTVVDKELEALLATRSGIPASQISAVFYSIKTIQNTGQVTDAQLIELNKLIEQFYQKAQ
ncbi:DUF4350 domain-containing protein [Pedobacter sp. MC2016-14]|uniref:DUF4350 domain-containing protein n=1 Tax=Pedobacter sp. MC2016-14 TaxID=2897327 RepID=UPI001E5FC3B5|nr:DUF4350 domain-containing protein [Pedobacter sp. MC2016-14]MCD0487018.1 DUF4350 domain-containing protein [Pedobacter sp. MC2016-14]